MNKAELVEEIETLCEKLDISLPDNIDSLNKAELEDELSRLQELDSDGNSKDSDPEPTPEPEPEGDSYIVAKASLRAIPGIIDIGSPIEVKDVGGGDENFNRLVELGYIVKK